MAEAETNVWDDFNIEDWEIADYVIQDEDEFEEFNSEPQQNPAQPPLYECPVCCKQLRSVSGFRSHTLKQHAKDDLKATEHIINRDDIESTEAEYKLLSEAEYKRCFERSVYTSLAQLTDIYEKKPYALFASEMLSKVASLNNKDSVSLLVFLLSDKVKPVVNVKLVTNLDREHFFSRLHEIKVDNILQDFVLENLGLQTKERSNIILYQMILRHISEQLVHSFTEKNAKETKIARVPLNDIERKVLYHIAGYIIHKTEKFFRKYHLHCLVLLDRFTTLDVKLLQNVQNASEWTQELDRGGLKYASQPFYLMIQEIDWIIQGNVNFSKLTCNTLIRDRLKEQIFDSSIVIHHWNNMVGKAGLSDTTLNLVFEFICELFITVKGYAVARKVRQDFEFKRQQSKLSMRHSLKQ